MLQFKPANFRFKNGCCDFQINVEGKWYKGLGKDIICDIEKDVVVKVSTEQV